MNICIKESLEIKNMANILPETHLRELLLLLLRRRKRLKVRGKSMLPLLQPGEEILINPHAYQKSKPEVGDIVVTIYPYSPEITIVKRITAIDLDGNYFLSGDNPAASTDSRYWGTIKSQDIMAKVTSRFS